MIIPCVSCQSMFRLEDIYVKEVGSKVRCSKCHEIFIVFPPDQDTESSGKNSVSNTVVNIAIPRVKHSLLDELFQGQNKLKDMIASTRNNERSKNSSGDTTEQIDSLEEIEEDEIIKNVELPDLSEIENIVDSILDERDHINNISPDIQAKYSLTQDLNFSGV